MLECGLRAVVLHNKEVVWNYYAEFTADCRRINTNQQNMLYKDMFSGDLNSTSIENGVYSIGTLDAVKNAPTGVSWCTFIQLKPYTTQVILDTSGCYMRKYTGSPAKWSQWQAF